MHLIRLCLHAKPTANCLQDAHLAYFNSATAFVSVPSSTLSYNLNRLVHRRIYNISRIRQLPEPKGLVDGGPMSSPRGKKVAGPPRPSSSVLLISPENTILLLHRVQTSSAFPSAHVFPGGNLEPKSDGDIPGEQDPARHQDGPAYRLGAVRETFEESGILLAKTRDGVLLEMDDAKREEGRKLVHDGKVKFVDWVRELGGTPDVENLIPFTRWITPSNVPKRFTTQMYIYLLPLASNTEIGSVSTIKEAIIPVPTHDGGLEHTAARFLPASQWLSMQQSGEVILFPPQVFLLTLISPFFTGIKASGTELLQKQRSELLEFVKGGDPPWGEKCISPTQVLRRKDGRLVLGLDKPGPELNGGNRRGEYERVVLVDFKKEGPRHVEVVWRKDVMEFERAHEML